jgi:hypothetical protein
MFAGLRKNASMAMISDLFIRLVETSFCKPNKK